MLKYQRGFTGVHWLFMVLFLVCAYGWVTNIVKVIQFAASTSEWAGITIMFCLRILGVFVAPLGVFLGFF